MKKLISFTSSLTIILAVVALIHLSPGMAQNGCSKIVAKDGSGDYTTIAAGINALSSGQTLCVKDGAYSEVIRIRGKSNLIIKNFDGHSPVIDGNFQLPDANCEQKDLACITWCYSGANPAGRPNDSCGPCESGQSSAQQTSTTEEGEEYMGDYSETTSGIAPERNSDGTCKPNGQTKGRSSCSYEALVSISNSRDIIFEGFEIKNSTGELLNVGNSSQATGIQVRNVNMHHSWGSGVVVMATPDTVFDGVRVWQAKMSYAKSCIIGGNALSINKATGGTVKNSFIYNNYGEGATTDASSNVSYLNNTLYDNFHTNLHVHGSRNSLIEGNLVFCSVNAPYPFQQRNIGILIADEFQSTGGNTSRVGENRTIINNLVIGCSQGIALRSQYASKMKDDTFAHNTIVAGRPKPGEAAATQKAFSFRPDSSSNVENSFFGNNLTIQDDGQMCYGSGCSANGLRQENNIFVNLTTGRNYINDPKVVSLSSWPPGQGGTPQGTQMIINNPAIITAAHLKPDYLVNNYQLTSSSPAQNKGTPLSTVTVDFLRQRRPTSTNHDLGAFENGSTSIEPTNTPSPNQRGDLNGDGQVNFADFTIIISKFGNPYTAADYNNVITNYRP